MPGALVRRQRRDHNGELASSALKDDGREVKAGFSECGLSSKFDDLKVAPARVYELSRSQNSLRGGEDKERDEDDESAITP